MLSVVGRRSSVVGVRNEKELLALEEFVANFVSDFV
jgi:hypothetical protein